MACPGVPMINKRSVILWSVLAAVVLLTVVVNL